MRSARDAGLAAKALQLPARTTSNSTAAAASATDAAAASAAANSGSSAQHQLSGDSDDEFNRQQPTPMSGRLNYQTRRGFMREVSCPLSLPLVNITTTSVHS